MNSFLNSWSPRILSVLRIITGFLFIWHGSQKLFNFPPKDKFEVAAGIYLVGAILELGGGVLILIGLLTRPVAFLLSGTMAVAYFGWHAGKGFLPLANGGELAVVYCFVFFYFIFSGGGAWSVDRVIWKKD